MDTDMSIRVIESKNESEIMNAIRISLNEGRSCFSYKDKNKYGAIISLHPRKSFDSGKTNGFPKYERPSKPGKMSENEVDWTKIPMWTRVQVRDGDNEEWKNAYFLSYEKDTNFQFEASFFDEFTSENTLVSEVYYQCRLYKED